METRKMLKLKLEQAEMMRDRYLAGMKALAERAEKLGEENEAMKAEGADLGPKYQKAMMANQALTKQWEKLKAECEELQKTLSMVENALEESSRVRKKLYYENQRLRDLIGVLELAEKGAEKNEA